MTDSLWVSILVALLAGFFAAIAAPFVTAGLNRRNWQAQKTFELKYQVFQGALSALASLAADALDPALQSSKAEYKSTSRQVEIRPETSQALEQYRGLVAALFSPGVARRFDEAVRTPISIENVPNEMYEEKHLEFVVAASQELGLRAGGASAMNEDKMLELSKHYDTIQWTVTTILTAAVGGLLVYGFSAENFRPALGVLGALLTLASVFFAASFRALRRRIHENLPASFTQFLRSAPMFRQWPIWLFIHALLFLAWVRLLVERSPGWKPLWWSLAAVGLLVIIVYGIAADRLPLGRKLRSKDA